MAYLILTVEQAQLLRESAAPLEVRDPEGRTVAHLTPLDPGDIEAIERYKRTRGNREPGIPSEQVTAHLRRLEEIRQTEGLDEAKAFDLLRRMRAGEEV